MTRRVLGLTVVIAILANGCDHPGLRRGGYVAGSVAFVAGIAMIAAAEAGPDHRSATDGNVMTVGAISAAVGAIALIALVATQPDDEPDDPATAAPPAPELDLSLPATR